MKRSTITTLIKDIITTEVSSTGGGQSMKYDTPKAFKKNASEYYSINYKDVPKKVKGSGLEVKQVFESFRGDSNESFQQKRIKSFDLIEAKLNDIYGQISNAKNDTVNYYNDNPSSFDILYSTDIIESLLNDIQKLLNPSEQ